MYISKKTIEAVETVLLLLIWIPTPLLTEARSAKLKQAYCPIGFTLAFTKEKNEPICYKLKGPETFADKFVDCAGNLYTAKLLSDLIFTPHQLELWADHKTLYHGGPFIDWSHSVSTGNILTSTFQVGYKREQGIDEEFCTVLGYQRNLTTVRCSEKYYRYCFVKPPEEMSPVGCPKDYWRFWSPRPTCLYPATAVGGGRVRATWRQSRELCDRHDGALLQRGWRYANHPILRVAGAPPDGIRPLGIVVTEGDSMLWLDSENGENIVPESEWNFGSDEFSEDSSIVAIEGDEWKMVNSTFLFYDVICEHQIQLPQLEMNVTYNDDGQLGLSVSSASVNEEHIWCFTDSVIFYPSRVKITRVEKSNNFILKPITDGYYWCIHSDPLNYVVSESNKSLFIREKQSVINLYSIKIRIKQVYTFENLDKLMKLWSRRLSEYIYLRTKYVQVYGDGEIANKNETESLLKQFKGQYETSTIKEEIIYYIKVKRVYLDRRTVLLHAQINAAMVPLLPGPWEDINVLFMKPAYYCKGFDKVPTLPLGEKRTSRGCVTYSCVGDFNEGAQWLQTGSEDCDVLQPVTVSTSVTINEPGPEIVSTVDVFPTPETTSMRTTTDKSSSEEESTTTILPTNSTTISTTEMTTTNTLPPECTTTVPTIRPPTTIPPITLPPEDQVLVVLNNLEELLKNESAPIYLKDIENAFDEVDEILELAEDVGIPGTLLHLLDKLGERAYLNGSMEASTVRKNLAIVVAKTTLNSPVRGLRLASRDTDVFNGGAFQVISDNINNTLMTANSTEAVVQLPDSVAFSDKRITFVIFRNDRAFQSVPGSVPHTINSRVLSVTVSDHIAFANGEVIDIHLRPMVEQVLRNESRSCAYWRFLENEKGIWSQEGCMFIPAPDKTLLDTCRCTHLTHFAEVLTPRMVFSESHENALEIITIVGCVFSIFGLTIICLTAIIFRTWRRDFSNKVWLQLSLAVLLLVLSFLTIIITRFRDYNVPCMLVGVVLHYAVLASFCWMLVAAIISYRRLVLVFTRDVSHKLLRASAFAWGTPCAIVGVLLSVDPHNYAGHFEELTPSGAFCYPTGLGLWLAVYAPIAVIILANWVLFLLIVRSVFASRRIQRHGDTGEALRCVTVSCLLVFLFGLPWVFGLFANTVAFAYLFSLTATFQGFVLFFFFVIGNKKTRDLWLNKLRIKQTRKVPVTSSTYKSSGWRGGSAPGVSTIEANSAKPRSLTARDESRFS